ncbi:MAG: FeoB small GTPase domain-containing protein [Alphaproteobacteria bacterium]
MSTLRLALVGAPNSGKSHPVQRPHRRARQDCQLRGVTVERRRGYFKTEAGRNVELIDLPGIYGFTARSLDERIAFEAITGQNQEEAPPDALLVLLDASDIRTHLHFVLQLRSLGRPMVLALNMMDLAERDGVRIDVPALERLLGVPVVATWATRSAGRAGLLARIETLLASNTWLETPPPPSTADLKAYQREARVIAKQVILAEPAMNKLTRTLDAVFLNKIAGPLILTGDPVPDVPGRVHLGHRADGRDRCGRRLAQPDDQRQLARQLGAQPDHRRNHLRRWQRDHLPAADRHSVRADPRAGSLGLHGARRLPDG